MASCRAGMGVQQRSQTRKPTRPRTQKTASAQRKQGRSISLLVVIMATVKQMQVIACDWRTIEKDYRQPSLIFAQLTLSQLVRQLITKPQHTPTTIGKNIVCGSTMQLARVRLAVSMSAPNPALPTLRTSNLSLRKALSMAPKMHPTPSVISRKPTLRLVRMSTYISLLMYVLMKPLTSPSRIITMNMQDILGQQRIEFKKIVLVCTHIETWAGFTLARATTVDDSASLSRDSGEIYYYRLSRKIVHTSQETKLSPVRIVKQIELPKYPRPKVVTMAPKRLLPYTMPLVIAKYFPSSFLGMPYRLKSFIRYPPWLTQQMAAPYPPKTAPIIPMMSPQSPLRLGMQTAQLMRWAMADIWNCHLNLVMAVAKMREMRQVKQLTARATSGPQLYCPSSCSAMQVIIQEKLRKVVYVSMKQIPRMMLCLVTSLWYPPILVKNIRNLLLQIGSYPLHSQCTFLPPK